MGRVMRRREGLRNLREGENKRGNERGKCEGGIEERLKEQSSHAEIDIQIYLHAQDQRCTYATIRKVRSTHANPL